MCSLDQVIVCGSPVSPFREPLGVGGTPPRQPPAHSYWRAFARLPPVPWWGQHLGGAIDVRRLGKATPNVCLR